MNITHIKDNIWLSGSIDNYLQLKENDIRHVINIKSESHDDINELTKLGIAYYWIPTGDYFAPRAGQVKTLIYLLKNIEGGVLIHCEEGRGRSAFMVICYLVEICNIQLQKSINLVKEKRPIVSLTDSQLDKLKKLYGG
jgi:atypical dual specificity phosphatase